MQSDMHDRKLMELMDKAESVTMGLRNNKITIQKLKGNIHEMEARLIELKKFVKNATEQTDKLHIFNAREKIANLGVRIQETSRLLEEAKKHKTTLVSDANISREDLKYHLRILIETFGDAAVVGSADRKEARILFAKLVNPDGYDGRDTLELQEVMEEMCKDIESIAQPYEWVMDTGSMPYNAFYEKWKIAEGNPPNVDPVDSEPVKGCAHQASLSRLRLWTETPL